MIGVCVLNAIGLQSDDYLSFALAEEIATSLARIRGLIVISSGSVAVAVAAKRNVREELGLDFLLEGSLQRAGERLRVTVKLVDAASGVVCWTSHVRLRAQRPVRMCSRTWRRWWRPGWSRRSR